MASSAPPQYNPRPRTMSAPDFETASIRSAAPSYISAAPSYSTLPFSPAPTSLPRVPLNREPSLDQFRIPTTRANPTARHYHSVAHRRATMASIQEQQAMMEAAKAPDPVAALRQHLADKEESEFGPEGSRVRPEEDPALVGEEAAELARRKRIGAWGDAILAREDRRWDWLLDQMKDWDERERSFSLFRSRAERRSKIGRFLQKRKDVIMGGL